jgi:hypothetical protein
MFAPRTRFTSRPHFFGLTLALAAQLFSACDNDSHPSDAGSSPSCADGPPTVIADLDTQSPAQLTGRQLLNRALGVHRVVLNRPTPLNLIHITPESLGVNGTIEIAHAGGAFRHIESIFQPCTTDSCATIGVICVNRIELDVIVRVRSDDGAFAEDWNALPSIQPILMR